MPNHFSKPRLPRSIVGLLLIACTGVNTAVAETSLRDAINSALDNHPQRFSVSAQRELGLAQQQRADTLFADRPTFNLKYQTDALNKDLGYQEWEGGVELPLRGANHNDRLRIEAQRSLGLADAMTAATELQVAGELRERLWQWALAEATQRDAEQALASAQRLQQDIQRRINAGELADSDLLLAQQETLTREDALQQANNRLQQAETRFRLISRSSDIPAAISETTLNADAVPENHPQLVLANAQLQLARAAAQRIDSERNSGTSLWLGGKTARADRNSNYDTAVGVELSIPFGGSSHSAPALAEAKLAVTNAEAEQTLLQRNLSDQLQVVQLDYQRTRNALALAQKSEALASSALALSQRAFELGEIDLVRLLRSRRDALSAKQTLEIRRLEVGQASARINQALGVIPQ